MTGGGALIISSSFWAASRSTIYSGDDWRLVGATQYIVVARTRGDIGGDLTRAFGQFGSHSPRHCRMPGPVRRPLSIGGSDGGFAVDVRVGDSGQRHQ